MSAPNPSTALALVLVDELARGGVTDAVVSPGSRSTALAMGFHDDPRIRCHVQVDERSAGFLAVGLARGSGRPVAVVCTSGTAAANLHPAVLEADAGRVPLLLLTSDRPPELRGAGANQTIDQIGLYGHAVRWFVEVGVPEARPDQVRYWRSTGSHAVAAATGLAGPPGPVHLNLAFREPTVPATDDGRTTGEPFPFELGGRPGGAPWTQVHRPKRTLSEPDVDGLASRIAATERGLLVVGDTTADPAAVRSLARGAGWPLVAEPISSARGGPDAIVHAHWLLGVERFARHHRPDLVLRVGRTALSRNVEALLGSGVPQILLDGDGSWFDPQRALAELVVADPSQTCAALAAALPAPAGSDWLSAWEDADDLAEAAVDEVLAGIGAPTEPQVARDVAAATPAGGTLVVASSMPVRDLDLVMAPREDLRVVGNRGVSGIDGFVSTALGVAATSAGATVALAGDLSFLHDRNGLLAALDLERVQLTVVVVDNDGGGIFSLLPPAAYSGSFERMFGTPHGLDLADVARTHRLPYERVDRAADVHDAVHRAVAAGGIRMLHVRTDRADNADLHRRLQAAVARALGA